MPNGWTSTIVPGWLSGLLFLLLFQVASGVAVLNAQPLDLPYPTAASKKGLQVEHVADALDLGIQHAALNLDLCRLIDPRLDPENPRWTHQGTTFAFHQDYLSRLDRDIHALSSRGILVNVILLTYQTGHPEIDRLLIHSDCIQPAPNRLGAFQVETREGRKWLEATVQFLAERWSGAHPQQGRVCGWIVGNEVNSHWWWSNMGRVPMERFVRDYQTAYRIIHQAVRSQILTARVYVSLEHHWTMRYPAGDDHQCFPARDFLQAFAEEVRQHGDLDWNIAFHPYPEDLFDPRFWEDQSAPDDDQAQRVTFRNLPVLLRFLSLPEMRFQGASRRVILSEQGFHSDGTAAGEQLQAAAWCYAYRLVDSLPGIDALILHRHIDHPAEGGLNLGLRRRAPDAVGSFEEQFPRKPIYDCFLKADGPQWEPAFEFAKPLIGIDRWPKSSAGRESRDP